MPLSVITRGEPVTAPSLISTYSYNDENSPFFHNYTGRPKRFQSNFNKYPNSNNQIVYMEKSVQEFLGHNLNLYV